MTAHLWQVILPPLPRRLQESRTLRSSGVDSPALRTLVGTGLGLWDWSSGSPRLAGVLHRAGPGPGNTQPSLGPLPAPTLAEVWPVPGGAVTWVSAVGGRHLSSQLRPAVPLPTEPAGAALQDSGQGSSPLTGVHPRLEEEAVLGHLPRGHALDTWGHLAELRAAR